MKFLLIAGSAFATASLIFPNASFGAGTATATSAVAIAPAVAQSKSEFRVKCLCGEAAKKALLDESLSPWFSLHGAEEVAAMTRVAVAPGADAPAESRKRFAAASVDFSPEEIRALEAACARVRRLAGPGASVLTERPWKFLKTAAGTTADLPHTRGDNIIFSKRMLDVAVSYETALAGAKKENRTEMERFWMSAFGDILLHEQMHVLQRTRPEIFASLYAKWGFEKVAPVAIPSAATASLTNPDAPVHDRLWRDASGGRWVFAMRLRKTKRMPNMMRDMTVLAWPVKATDGVYAVSGESVPVSEVPGFSEKFGLPDHSCDHPNELAAYLTPAALAALRGESTPPEGNPAAELAACLREAK